MKHTFKKLGALALVVVMLLALSVPAFADTSLTSGTQGNGGASAALITGESVVLEKEITAFNKDGVAVAAPTITYTYTIAAGSADKDVKDADGVAVKTKAGITANVVITGTEAGKIAWTTADDLNTSNDGVKNKKDLTISFADVVFTGAGVYRYEITEALDTGFTYANTGVTEGSSHKRYLDVYVKDGTGTGKDAYDVYGFALFAVNNGIDGTDPVSVAAAKKTTGFVNDTTSNLEADKYYTYNLTISKTLTGDNANNNHQFPFTVNFTNGDITQNVLLKTNTSGTVTDYTRATSAIGSQDGVAKLAGGGTGSSIKYIGIPVGTDASVFETNDVTGTTYKAITTKDGSADAGKSISWTTTPASAATYSVQAYNSLEAQIDTTKDTKDETSHTVAIANALELISPTGVVLRVAPYALMLGIGMILVLFTRRRKAEEEA